MCQCPISGFPHFYEEEKPAEQPKEMCQCPISGFPHFYCRLGKHQIWLCFTVSMPYIGLPPFLLYPFKNPLKSMVSGAVFRG